MTVLAPMVTGYIPWKTTLSAIVAVGSAFSGAFGGPELEEEDRWVFVGGLRVAILFVVYLRGCICGGSIDGDMGWSYFGAIPCRFCRCALSQPHELQYIKAAS
jgi:hypothetical protein